jgi:hypothetical protein
VLSPPSPRRLPWNPRETNAMPGVCPTPVGTRAPGLCAQMTDWRDEARDGRIQF